ncbi:MAG: copper resistance protein NlpE [Pseudomonadota bacterium]|nr:copper resistance protein NlpE [Pseudomonadota bacterium]
MAEINIEKKKSIWPWIIAAIVLIFLIWAVVAMLDRDPEVATVATRDAAVVDTTVAGPETTALDAPGTDGMAAGSMERYAGMYVSENMQLNLNANGTYALQESPAGEAMGLWTHDASANALRLTPSDGSVDRYFRVEGPNTLTPLSPDGDPAMQMAQLERQITQ